MIFDWKELTELYVKEGVSRKALECRDRVYRVVSKSDIRRAYEEAMRRLPEDLRAYKNGWVFRWIEEAFDCENHSEYLSALMTEANGLRCALDRTELRAGILFGVIGYHAEPREENGQRSGGHAINTFVTVENGRCVVRYFEPGDNEFVELTPTERRSAWVVKFS